MLSLFLDDDDVPTNDDKDDCGGGWTHARHARGMSASLPSSLTAAAAGGGRWEGAWQACSGNT